MLRTLVLVALLAGCGSNKPLFVPADKVPHTGSGSGGGSGSGAGSGADPKAAEAAREAEMATMPPAVAQFHDILAPRWHEEPGPKRMSDTCSALADFHSGADAIAKATPPTTANADTWTNATKALVAAVNGLDAPCRANNDAQFEPAFAKVHDAFHALLAAAGGGHTGSAETPAP